jgi:hypothetical protein
MNEELNKEYIRCCLKEARDAIHCIFDELDSDADFDIVDYSIRMNFLYQYINAAWNARFTTMAQVEEATQSERSAWEQFPADLDIME